MQDRSRQLAKGFAYASFTFAMLGAMHGFGELTSLVWLGAAALALGAVATWTIGHRAQFAGQDSVARLPTMASRTERDDHGPA
jgi:hypothetical protein